VFCPCFIIANVAADSFVLLNQALKTIKVHSSNTPAAFILPLAPHKNYREWGIFLFVETWKWHDNFC
jgi:hypothetical protein